MTDRHTQYNYGTIDDEEVDIFYAGELPEEPTVPVEDEGPPVVMEMYEKAMETHPVLTTVLQTFFLVLFSDICAQVIRAVLVKGDASIDWVRLYAVGTWSVIFMGPST